MQGRGRTIAVALVVLALLLSAGRWGSVFLSERLWEAAVSAKVAEAGTRRALLGLGLELAVLAIASAWLLFHVILAARIALPDRAPPEQDAAKTWPPQLPRWSLTALAIVMGVLLGGGAGKWLDELLLALDGARIGMRDPLLGADLGVFLGRLPLWLELQRKAVLLSAVSLAAVILLHLAGETIRVTGRRLWISPRARPQLAVLLGVLALSLSWSCGLERYRLAAGMRGPLLPSEFLLRSLVSKIQVGVAGLAALFSVLWWHRMRGSAVAALWALFLLVFLVGRGLPLHSDAATADPIWQASARDLDSVAFQLAGLDGGPRPLLGRADSLRPTLWDDTVLAEAADSGMLSEPRRGWIEVAGRAQPVWLAVREPRAQLPELLALSDDRVAPSGGPVFWPQADSLPSSGTTPFRILPPHSFRPLARRIEITAQGPGVVLDSWSRRLVLAWALQAPAAFSARAGARMAWRLDPGMRLRAVAPFARWTPPRARVTSSGLVWQSDGLLESSQLPSSARVRRGADQISMLRSSFLGVVDAVDGSVRIIRRSASDSLAAAWARITRPLIEPASAGTPELRSQEAYPGELLAVQAQVLEGAPWAAGRIDRLSGGTAILPPEAAGGTERIVTYNRPGTKHVAALLVARRTASGDSLRLVRLDSLWTVDSGLALKEAWNRFPFQQALSDSVFAAGASLQTGQVRYALVAEGVVAYQPAWSVTASNQTQLILVNLALGRGDGAKQMSLGTGRNLKEAWRNLRREISPGAVGLGAQAILEQARRLILHADSARKHGDLQELGRTLAELLDLLQARRP